MSRVTFAEYLAHLWTYKDAATNKNLTAFEVLNYEWESRDRPRRKAYNAAHNYSCHNVLSSMQVDGCSKECRKRGIQKTEPVLSNQHSRGII